MNKYKMTDLGPAQLFLSIQIVRNRAEKTIFLHQTRYIDTVLKRFGMEDVNGVYTPLPAHIRLRETDNDLLNPAGISLYLLIVGSLMYAMTSTRPDLAFTISRLSKFSLKPMETHLAAAKHALRYLKKT